MTTGNATIESGSVAWLFPGQGSQRVGMGAEVFATEPTARRILAEADETLGFALSRVIADGPASDLEQTPTQQPAILVVSIAYRAVLRERGLLPDPDFVVGHSLGEYSALVASGAMSLADGVRLVRRRGQLMQDRSAGGMAAIIGLDLAAVTDLAERTGVEVANINAPGQIVVSGPEDAIDRIVETAREQGAKRAIRLPVSGAFHSSLMATVVDELGPDIDAVALADLTAPLVSNVTTLPITAAADLRRELRDQICAPVRWVEVVERIAAAGVGTAFEIGPGKVLTGLVARIAPGLACTPAEQLLSTARA